MAETTNIAWTDATFNPWIGCTKVGPGCDHCYASVSTPARTLGVVWGAGQQRSRTSAGNWNKPLRWNALAANGLLPDGKTPTNGRRPRVFCASLADVFDNEIPLRWRQDLMKLIAVTPDIDWLLLTKRIGNARKMLSAASDHLSFYLTAGDEYKPPANLWLGATIVNQEEADRDIPKLLATPAAKRFVSYEPALGPVDFRPFLAANDLHKIDGGPSLDWVIVGGESSQPGHPARPFDIAWARDTVRQCREAGVAAFFKQAGSNPVWHDLNTVSEFDAADSSGSLRFKDRAGADPAEWPEDLRVREFPK